MESETRKGIYTSRKKGKGARWEIYMNEGGEEDRRYSAFEPLLNLDQLKENREYTYQVVHVPTKDDPNKFHHNFGRVGKDMDFVIEWTGEEKKPAPIQAKVTDAPKPYTPQPGRTQTDDREKYWAEREKRDKEKERIYELRLPYINAVNLMPGVCAIIAGMMNHAQGYEEVNKIGIDKTAELLLRQMEAIVQQRLPPEAAYQQPKTEKKEEPIEASP